MSFVAVFRLLLRLYPEDFRVRNGAEMVRFFEERLRDAGRRGRGASLRLLAGTAVDAVITSIGLRIDGWRSMRRGGGMDGWMMDVRYALRGLARNPGFTAVTVVTIALGIGVNTAIFSVVRSVLLEPLPYDDPDGVVLLWGEMRNRDVNHFPASPPDLQDYRTMSESFEEIAGVFYFAQSLTGDGEPQQVQVGAVSEGFFDVFRIEPQIGRGFVPEDHVPAANGAQGPAVNNSVLLTHGLWIQRWGGDPEVVGRVVDIGGAPAEVVGVLPADFRPLFPASYSLGADPVVWQAARIDPAAAPRNNVFLRLVGRLGPGMSLQAAQSEMDRIGAEMRDRFEIRASSDHHLHVESLQAELTRPVRPVIMALAGAVVFVLLVACANVSNLLLVRATSRRQELAVRAALGGGRWRLVRGSVTEGLLLATVGGILGVALASVGIEALVALEPGNVPRIDGVGIDAPVLLFTAAAIVLSAVLMAVLPALQSSGTDVRSALGNRGRIGGSRRMIRSRDVLVVTEVALSMVLLIGAGLLVRSFVSLNRVDPGFEARNVLSFSVNLPFGRYPTAVEREQAVQSLRLGFEAIPGVTSATVGFPLPLDGNLANVRWGPEEALADPGLYQQADAHFVGRDYFQTLGTPLLAGRSFTDAEHSDSVGVVVIDRILAERAFPDGDPVGQRMLIRSIQQEPEWHEVIGVAEHQRHTDLTTAGTGSVFMTQRFVGTFGGSWAVRGAGDPLALVPAIRSAVSVVDPLVPVADVEPYQATVDRARAPARFAVVLMGTFAALAALLASVGLYGVLAHVVRERTAEIGVRMAFGAPREDILRSTLFRGLRLAVVGIGLGLVGATALARGMEQMLVGVQPRDPTTFAGVVVLFLGVAAGASLVPALRASRVTPSVALRKE
jgi:putative ABC transport system permease protein